VGTAIKTGAQVGLQKIENNATIQKGVESMKITAQKVSESMNQTFNDVKSQTNREIEVEHSKQAPAPATTEAVPINVAPTPISMDNTPPTINQ